MRFVANRFDNRTAIRCVAQTTFCALLLSLFAVGCATPGPPRPPSLNLPQAVTDLAAERVGDRIVFSWTTPAKTTENLALKGTLTANICLTSPGVSSSANRRPASAQASPASCVSFLHQAVKSGPSTATETLSPPLNVDPAALLEYHLQIENAAGRSAPAFSNPAFVVAGAAPPPVQEFQATVVPSGVLLEWRTNPAFTTVELERTDETLAATQKGAPAKSKTSIRLAGKQSPQAHLRAAHLADSTGKQAISDGDPSGSEVPRSDVLEPGGTIDQSAHFGDTYTYTAQRVLSLQLGGHHLQLRSALSAPVTLTLRDTFPPAVPRGLEAVLNPTPHGSVKSSIDLSWEPGTDADLAGYQVYRQPLDSAGNPIGSATRISTVIVLSPTYSDVSAIPAQRYRYTVTALDATGNESRPSSPVEEMLP